MLTDKALDCGPGWSITLAVQADTNEVGHHKDFMGLWKELESRSLTS